MCDLPDFLFTDWQVEHNDFENKTHLYRVKQACRIVLCSLTDSYYSINNLHIFPSNLLTFVYWICLLWLVLKRQWKWSSVLSFRCLLIYVTNCCNSSFLRELFASLSRIVNIPAFWPLCLVYLPVSLRNWLKLCLILDYNCSNSCASFHIRSFSLTLTFCRIIKFTGGAQLWTRTQLWTPDLILPQHEVHHLW